MAIDYEQWKQEHAVLLATFPQKKVFMLFTGGKDSSVILWLLLKASREFGFSFETSTGRFPAQVYPDAEVERLDTFWRAQGVEITWPRPPQLGQGLDCTIWPRMVCRTCRT